VRVCGVLDYFCTMPIADAMTDQPGDFQLDLSQNSSWNRVYFEVTPPNDDYRTHLFHVPAWTLTHSQRRVFNVYPRGSTADVPSSNPGLGGVLFFTYDCKQSLLPWARAAGVEVTASPAGSATRYTLEGLSPNSDAKFTDANGVGWITDLPPGKDVILNAVRYDTKEHIGTTPITIRADGLTIVELVPTP
jgi:hypothetical protein